MPRDIRCVYMAHVGFMSFVVTVWGSVGMFVLYRAFLKIVFLPWSGEVCCVFMSGV